MQTTNTDALLSMFKRIKKKKTGSDKLPAMAKIVDMNGKGTPS